MKICVLGLGYVGAVSAGLLAKEGHEVIGVDPERTKVDLINEGRSPIIEKDLGEIIAEQVKSGRLHAATNIEDAVRHTDLSFVCVGTPSQPNSDIETAEMVKYADNGWHALKVGFANEIGSLCKALEVDAHKVMEIFCQDHKLNLSPYYLKPGFAFGGSCLPKDLRALLYKAKTLDVSLPILASVLPSNQLQIERGVQAVVEKGAKRIGILGFSFKAEIGRAHV